MAKRLSSSQSNTLLNYFQSPKSNKTPSKCEDQKKPPSNDSDEEDVLQPMKKRSRQIIDSDSDNENIETPTKTSKRGKFESSGEGTPKSSKKLKFDSKKRETPKSKTKSLDKFVYSSESTSVSEKEIETSPEVFDSEATNGSSQATRWTHESLKFLQPQHIRDINKNRPNDPNYDPKTLYVPNDFLNNLTPAMRQWWILKSSHFDCVLFFKVGKFYELYHMDAVVGVNHLGFTYMKGDFAHSGFPETAYGKMASSLIEQGFKVARVEQTETPQMMSDRCRDTARPTKYDKVVKREICQISGKGACLLGAQITNATNAHSSYMMSIVENITDKKKKFGICFVDTTIGTFYLSEFEDDIVCSRLLSLLSEHPASLIIIERGRLSSYTNDILKKSFGAVKKEMLIPEKQFYSASTVIKKLYSECYFKNEKDEVCLPALLERSIDGGSPKPDCELKLHALGGVLWYLQESLIDIQLLSMGNFESYFPLDILETPKTFNQKHMVLDSTSLNNLKILGGQGTLQKTLDFCCTPFGKRLLQNWICRPLCDLKLIQQRQVAVQELYNKTDLLMQTRDLMSKLPDLERQISKIHIFGNRHVAKIHPDSRAILYESKQYTKRKIFDLLSTLEAFQVCLKVPEIFEESESPLLVSLTKISPIGAFGDISGSLKFFKEAFDHEKAKQNGCIIPAEKVDKDYDECERNIGKVQDKLDEYLQEQCKFFKCEVKYFGNDKKRFQIEVPVTMSKFANNTYMLEGTRKGNKPVNRYSTEKSRKLLLEMMEAEGERSKVLQDLNRRIFERFAKDCEEWNAVIKSIAILDCLCSLAEYARRYSSDICLPKLHDFADKPFCLIKNGKHPCIKNVDNFIPNDTDFEKQEQNNILILTGPNMGGKSTLMRQVVLIGVIAQIGGLVPAASCEMSLIDRIFTRLGAHDDIIKHRSTFLVEMEEASSILKHASRHSFVLLDELGRGTSTHDGNAIATAYVKKLCNINCRTIFSTHYHSLVEYYEGHKNIQLGYMTCMVENEGDANKEKVIFLYKMDHGICPKSYGFNVAALAGLKASIVDRARFYANKFESIDKNRQLIADIFTRDVAHASKLISGLKL